MLIALVLFYVDTLDIPFIYRESRSLERRCFSWHDYNVSHTIPYLDPDDIDSRSLEDLMSKLLRTLLGVQNLSGV